MDLELRDVYGWMHSKWGGEGDEHLRFGESEYPILLMAKRSKGKISLSFRLSVRKSRRRKSRRKSGPCILSMGTYDTGNCSEEKSGPWILSMGTYDTGNCSEESIQNNLLPMLLWLFFDPFIVRSSKVVSEALSGFLDMFRDLKVRPGIIEPIKYRQVFNSLISAGCTFFANDMEDELLLETLAQTQQNILLLMGLEGTHRFMGFLASALFLLSSLSPSSQAPLMQRIFERVSKISYNSSKEGSWMIMSYSPLSSLTSLWPENEYQNRLRAHLSCVKGQLQRLAWGLKNNLLHFVLQLEPIVDICPNCIKVRLHLDNVRCDVLQLQRISGKPTHEFPNVQLFPTKILFTISPENGSVVQSVSLGLSSANPITDIGRGITQEGTIQTHTAGLRAATSTTFTEKSEKWKFGHLARDNTHGGMVWTLNDTKNKAVFDNKKFSSKTDGSIYRAFTEQGGVVFAKDKHAEPITWMLDTKCKGKTLKWNVKGCIWLTHWPDKTNNWLDKTNIQYFETKLYKFHQVVDLTL